MGSCVRIRPVTLDGGGLTPWAASSMWMATTASTDGSAAMITVHGRQGAPSRHVMVTDVLRHAGHEHYRVRWDEEHESLFFPDTGEGVHIVHPEPH